MSDPIKAWNLANCLDCEAIWVGPTAACDALFHGDVMEHAVATMTVATEDR